MHAVTTPKGFFQSELFEFNPYFESQRLQMHIRNELASRYMLFPTTASLCSSILLCVFYVHILPVGGCLAHRAEPQTHQDGYLRCPQ